jgi:hypothetical protein
MDKTDELLKKLGRQKNNLRKVKNYCPDKAFDKIHKTVEVYEKGKEYRRKYRLENKDELKEDSRK